MKILRKYGEAATIPFSLFEVDGVNLRVDAVYASGDVKITKDEAAEANITTGFTDEGSAYSIPLSATEMEAARITIVLIDQTATKVWLDRTITIETYGHTSAQHAFDLDTALVTLAAATHTGAVIPVVTDVTNLHASAATAAALAVVDGNVDAILVDTSATLNDMIADIQGAGFISGTDSLEALQTALSVVDAAIATVDTTVDAILVDTGTTLDGKINAMQGAGFVTGTDSLEAIRDRGDSSWVTGAGGTPPQLLQSTSIQTLTSQTVFTLAAGSTDDNAYNGAVIVFEDALTTTQKAVGQVLSYVGSTKTITLVADPGIFTFAAADKIEILANTSGGATSSEIADAVWDEEIIQAHQTPDTAGDIIGRWIIGLLD